MSGREAHPTERGFYHDPSWVEFVPRVVHKPGFSFDTYSDALNITLVSPDSTGGTDNERTHRFEFPAANLDPRAKGLFVLQSIIKVDIHEDREFFMIDGERWFVPNHTDVSDWYEPPHL